ncbi:MAG: PDZ domain-containing protein, partial [Gammaproteobacteria bacterium]|nr:PDZ domain-containing protein [Gammaproteobacteria bacterium]
IQDVNAELAESFGMKKPQGALVAKVLDDSPAAEAGFEVGDIVIRYDGEYIRYSSDLPPMVGLSKVGESVPVEIIRHGKKKTLKVTIARLPDEDVIKTGSGKPDEPARSNALNVRVRDLTDEQREEYDLEDHGVIVHEIQPGPAQQAGIRKGDIIALINNIRVKDREHFQEIVSNLPADKSIPVLIQRRGGPIFLALKLDETEDS